MTPDEIRREVARVRWFHRIDLGGGIVTPGDDEVLYVLSGTGRATIGGDAADLTAGTAAYVASGTPWPLAAIHA